MNPIFSLTALLLASATALYSADAPKQKPNIVWMISDDHGAGDLGCYGNRDVRTPNLDRLAAEGMRFNLAVAASSLCSPSRAVIHTGLMPFRNGGHVFGGHVTKGTKTVSHYLQPLGYETALFGKTSPHPESAFPYDVKMQEWKPGAHESVSLPKTPNCFKRFASNSGNGAKPKTTKCRSISTSPTSPPVVRIPSQRRSHEAIQDAPCNATPLHSW